MATNVPSPSFTPTGFSAPPESQILVGVQEDIDAAFGGGLNFGTTGGSLTNSTPQGQLAASMAAIIGNVNDTFLFFSTQTDPAFAEGRFQDAIGRIYFIERIGAIPTTLQLQCIGAAGTTIPAGALVVDPGNNLYGALSGGVIGVSGSVGLTFTASVSGALAVPNVVSIYQAISGWDTVTLVSGTPGQDTESRAAFEQRRALSTAANSLGSLPSVLGTVLSVPGVLQAVVLENTSSSPASLNGVVLAPNSIYVSAYGGAPTDVARAIWSKKMPGCAYSAGNTSVTIQDTSPGYSAPFPTYVVTYQVPNPLPLLFSVSIVNSAQVPSDAAAQIQNAIMNAGSGAPNALNVVDGPAVQIGGKTWASRFVPPIAALGSWAAGNVINISIGSNNDPDASSAIGYCTGTSLTITSLTTGTIGVGQTLSVSNGSGVILAGTTIVAQVSGSAGGTGVYTVSLSQQFGQVNLLLQSNTFSNAAWTLVNSTVTGSAGTSPDGTNDSWKWQRSGTAAAYAIQTITKIGSPLIYTFDMYAKAGSGNFLTLYVDDNAGNSVQASFDVLQGMVATPAVGSGFTNVLASVQPSTSGFFRCSVTFTTTASVTLRAAWCGNASNVGFGGTDSLGNTNIIAFGAQLEPGSVTQAYIPTTGSVVAHSTIGFATPDQTSVQARLDQIPTIAANNIVVNFQ